jgi:DNA-binding transcriptional ArsR family regulator
MNLLLNQDEIIQPLARQMLMKKLCLIKISWDNVDEYVAKCKQHYQKHQLWEIDFKEVEFNGLDCFDNLKLNQVYRMLSFLKNKKAIRVLTALGGNTLNVTELMIKLRDISHSEISAILSHFRKFNLVYYEVRGKSHYYQVNRIMIKKINKAIKKL